MTEYAARQHQALQLLWMAAACIGLAALSLAYIAFDQWRHERSLRRVSAAGLDRAEERAAELDHLRALSALARIHEDEGEPVEPWRPGHGKVV